MREEAAANQIERVVGEGKRQRIRRYRAVVWQQVRARPIKMGDIEFDSSARKLLARHSRDFTKYGSYLEHGESEPSSGRCDALYHSARCSHASEPAVDTRHVLQRGCDLVGRAVVGVEDFGDVDSLHSEIDSNRRRKQVFGITTPSDVQTSASSSSSSCLLYRSL